MDHETQLFLGIGYCVLLLVIALLFQKYPPKKRNWYYGYRTSRSMANEAVWKMANDYSSRLMVRFCWYTFLIPALMYLIYPEYNFLVTVLLHSAIIVSLFFFTERYLNQHFDRNGNPK
ncbi:MAG: SdpI family protein [Bacteroidota bacterium]